MNKQLSFEQAARLIPDGAVVAVNSSSGLNCPDRMLAAIGERFAAEGRPRGLTLMLPISAGDMYGIKGIDHVAKKGLLARVLAGSYPSGPSSMEPPAIWKMIAADEVAAYNVPSGVLYDMLRDAAGRRAGVLTRIGLDTFVDPRRNGCKMNAAARDDIVRLVQFNGEEWLHFSNLYPGVAIVRGTTADDDGNVSMEEEGAQLGPLDVALAARNSGGTVIAQVTASSQPSSSRISGTSGEIPNPRFTASPAASSSAARRAITLSGPNATRSNSSRGFLASPESAGSWRVCVACICSGSTTT